MPYKELEKKKENAKQYYSIHKEKMNQRAKQWSQKPENKKRYNQNKQIHLQESFENFLGRALIIIRAHDRQVNRPNDLDLEYLLELLEQQAGCCAISGVKMTHQRRDLRAVSIDRIDNTLGHIKRNIQLVCMFVNVGKNNKSDIEVHSIIREIEYNILKKLKAHGYIITKKED